jgi:hypothetical protein
MTKLVTIRNRTGPRMIKDMSREAGQSSSHVRQSQIVHSNVLNNALTVTGPGPAKRARVIVKPDTREAGRWHVAVNNTPMDDM